MKFDFKSILFSLILFLTGIQSAFSQTSTYKHPFDNIKGLAEKGLELYLRGEKTEETLQILQEAMVRGQDWLRVPEGEELLKMNEDNLDMGEDALLMSNVVGSIMLLRKELRKESDQELMFLLLSSAVSSASVESSIFENIPQVYPDFKEVTRNPCKSMKEAIDLMAAGNLKEAEKILMILYYDSWYNGSYEKLKFDIANKLGLLYLKLKMPEQCYSLLRTNKTEMERNAILNKHYVEALVYIGFTQLENYSTPVIGSVFLEVADGITKQINLNPDEIISVYTKVLSAQSDRRKTIVDFIESNDKNFYFLTEKERILRWGNIKKEWEDLKEKAFSETEPDINELLNAFQYEKQILLRSAIKVKERLKESNDTEAIALLDSLLKIKMDMTTPTAVRDRYDKLDADYQRIQKFLMHHNVLKKYQDLLYSAVTVNDIASDLKGDETFIDFGKIKVNGNDHYVAILINPDNPEGLVKLLMPVNELRDFIKETETESSKDSVKKRYDNDFLYEKLWKPLESTGMIREKVLYCPTDELNVIMLDAINSNGTYLGEELEFHILSSADNIESLREGERYVPENILSICDIDYVGNRENLIEIAQRFGSERPLKKHFFDVDEEKVHILHLNTSFFPLHKEEEFDWFKKLGEEGAIKTNVLSGEYANEYIFKSLSSFKGALNISTHAFNLPRGYKEMANHYACSEFIRLVTVEPFTLDLLPLYRTGLFLAGGERSWTGRNFIDDIEDGILNGEEISSLDLNGLELVTLMACSTGAGEVDEYEGIIGIRRALKMAGCKTIVTTAWNVDKDAAITYLKAFYTNLAAGKGIQHSHRSAQLELVKKYEDPYYWAVFQLVD